MVMSDSKVPVSVIVCADETGSSSAVNGSNDKVVIPLAKDFEHLSITHADFDINYHIPPRVISCDNRIGRIGEHNTAPLMDCLGSGTPHAMTSDLINKTLSNEHMTNENDHEHRLHSRRTHNDYHLGATRNINDLNHSRSLCPNAN